MMFSSGIFTFLAFVLLSYNSNMVTAQCQPNNWATSGVSSTQLTISWRCYDPDADDELQVNYQLTNRGKCDTGDGSVDPPFDIQTLGWGTHGRQTIHAGNTYEHSATLTNVLPYSTYRVSVKSRFPDLDGGYSTGYTRNIDLTTSAAAPGAFDSSNITLNGISANQLDFQWTIPCSSRNGVITGYNYYVTYDNGAYFSETETQTTSSLTSSASITGLSCGTTYRLYVAGINNQGTGPYSDYKTAPTTCCLTGPGSVRDLRTTSVSATQIRLSWTAPIDIGCPAPSNLQYTVTYIGNSLQDGCTLTTNKFTATTSLLSLMITSLRPNYEYAIGVYAEGGEANAEAITVSTQQLVPGAVPTLWITAASSTSLDVSWNAPINECPPDSYTVATQLTNLDQCHQMTGQIIPAGSPTGLSYQVTGLTPYSSYTVYVTPVNTAGDGITSEVSGTTAQTVPTVMPNLPTNALDSGSNFITFGWYPIPCESRGGLITYRYELRLNDGSDMVARDGTTSDSVTLIQTTFIDLMCSTDYVFRVRAVTEAGEGPWSQDYVTGTSLMVTTITFTNTLATELHTTWTVDTLGCGLHSHPYLVEYMLVNKDQCEAITGGTRITGGTTMETSFTLTGLLPYSTYQVFVTPMVGTGFSVSRTTSQNRPTAGPAVTVVESTLNNIAFFWTEVPCGSRGGLIIRYHYKLTKRDDNTIVTDQDTADATQMSVNFPDLALGQMYEFQIAAINEAGTGPSTTITANTIAGPDPPKSVTLLEDASKSTSLKFSWTAVSCDDMDTCTSIGGYSYTLTNLMDYLISNGETSASETFVVISSLDPCTSYRFSVAAKSEVNITGSYSDYVEGTTAIAEPSAVSDIRNLSAVDSSTALLIVWEAPSGQCTTNFYSVKYILRNRDMCEVLDEDDVKNHGDVSDTEAQFSDLEPFSLYTILVTPHNAAGDGSEREANVTTGEQPPSAPPSNIRNTNITTDAASFVWDEVPCGSRHGNIQIYQCQLVNTTDSVNVLTKNSSSTDVTFDGLQPCTEYTFSVAAMNGPMSNVTRITTDSVAPSPVSSIEALPATPSTDLPRDPTVQWTPSSESLCPATTYLVHYNLTYKDQCIETPNDAIQTNTTVVMGTKTTLSGLLPHSTYLVSVTARNDAGDAAPVHSTDTHQTGEEAPSGPPATVMLTDVGQRSLSVIWMEPVCGERNGEITMYSYVLTDLYRDTYVLTDLYRDTSMSSTTSDTSVEFTDLTPYVRYAFKVSAWTSVGQGPFSNVIYNRTSEDTPPAPLSLSVSNADTTSIEFQWSPPDPPYGVITGYDVQYWDTGDSMLHATRGTSTTLEYTVTGLKAKDQISFQVRAETSAGKGEWSDVTTGEAKEGKPGPPDDFDASNVGDTSVMLQWTEPTNPNGVILDYTIMYRALYKAYVPNFSPDKEFKPILVPASANTSTIEQLGPSSKYEIKISARTSAGPGMSTASIEVFTKPYTDLAQPEDLQIDGSSFVIVLSDSHKYVSNVYISVSPSGAIVSRKRRQQSIIDVEEQNIVANITRSEITENYSFTVGDNKTYGGYVNKPLTGGKMYDVMVAHASCTPESCSTAWSKPQTFTAPLKDKLTGNPSSSIAPIIIGILVIIIFVVLVVVIYLKRETLRTHTIRFIESKKDSEVENGVHENPAFLKDEPDTAIDPLSDEPTPDMTAKTDIIKNPPTPLPRTPMSTRKVPPVPDSKPDTPRTPRTPRSARAPTTPQTPRKPRVHEDIHVDKIREHIEKKTAADDDNGFNAEFKDIPGEKQLHPWEDASLPENFRIKNRFVNILPYDRTRVKLSGEDDPATNYINASYVGAYGEKRFVASQGPLPDTVGDMWQLAWEQKSTKILMLTNLIEKGRVKCHRYWPAEQCVNQSTVYGEFQVIPLDVEEYADYTIRSFRLAKEGEEVSLDIKQFHFTSWPDFGVPKYATPVLNFIKAVNSYDPGDGGIPIIHCSAGVGRTGTFLTIDSMIDMIKEEGKINIPNFVTKLRQARIMMVQTVQQYQFIYEALLEATQSIDTGIMITNLREEYASLLAKPKQKKGMTGMESQFKLLEDLEKTKHYEGFADGEPANADKNRFPDKSPSEARRLVLETPGEEGSADYINAAYVDSYRRKDAFITTQMTMPNTTSDIWRMAYEFRSPIIVMLNAIDSDDPTIADYCPEESTTLSIGSLEIEHQSTTELADDVMGRSFKIINTHEAEQVPRMVMQMEYKGWSLGEDTPDSDESFLAFIALIQKQHEENGRRGPITVHCLDGLGRSGVLCGIISILERMQSEKVVDVDVFQEVKRLRMCRPGMVENVIQYKYLYATALASLDMYNSYENFSPIGAPKSVPPSE